VLGELIHNQQMNQNPTGDDWETTRGDKWLDQLAGMEAMLAPVDEPLIAALRLDAPLRLAEIGCGGGGTALEMLRKAPKGSLVHGFDIAPMLVDRARGRAPRDSTALAFDLADMGTAPAPGELYDRLYSRFGMLFFADELAAFRNLLRWLTPGGRFAFAAWGATADNPWMTLTRDATAEVIDLPAPDPDGPGGFRYADAAKFLSLLSQAGFADLNAQDWRGSFAIGGGLPAAEAASFALASFASFGELLAEAGDEAFDDACRRLTARFAAHERGGAVHLDARVHIVTGARAV
jgi:SAM-dependent methyltransferase